MEVNENYMIFQSDEEFADFVFAPYSRIHTGDDGTKFYDSGSYSDGYLNAVRQGIIFVIMQADSKVCRRGIVNKRLPLLLEDGAPYQSRTVLGQLDVENVIDSSNYQKTF